MKLNTQRNLGVTTIQRSPRYNERYFPSIFSKLYGKESRYNGTSLLRTGFVRPLAFRYIEASLCVSFD